VVSIPILYNLFVSTRTVESNCELSTSNPGIQRDQHLMEPRSGRSRPGRLAIEALDWINSLELPAEEVAPSHEYFSNNARVSTSGGTKRRVLECRAKQLRHGWTTWVAKHNQLVNLKGAAQRDGPVQRERMSELKLRLVLKQWMRFVGHCYLSNSAATYISAKYVDRMKHKFKMRMILLYWSLRTRQRSHIKARCWRAWRIHCGRRALLARVSCYF
jgi:hypothetical protein